MTDITSDKEYDMKIIWDKLDEIFLPIFEKEASHDKNRE